MARTRLSRARSSIGNEVCKAPITPDASPRRSEPTSPSGIVLGIKMSGGSLRIKRKKGHYVKIPDGHVKDLITGHIRKRISMDDFPENKKKMDEARWVGLMDISREQRGHVDGYESGDSEFEFENWEAIKKVRARGKRTRSIHTPEASNVPEGCVRDRITGAIRVRNMIDDFPDDGLKLDEDRWDEIRGILPQNRGFIDSYESGDSDLELDEWQRAKKLRAKARRQ